MPFDGSSFRPEGDPPPEPRAAKKRADIGEIIRMVAALILTLAMALGPLAQLIPHASRLFAHR